MLGNVIQRYGPTAILIVIAVLLWARLEQADQRIVDLRSDHDYRFYSLEAHLRGIDARINAGFGGIAACLETRFAGIRQEQAAVRERIDRISSEVEAMGDQLAELAGHVTGPQEAGGPAE